MIQSFEDPQACCFCHYSCKGGVKLSHLYVCDKCYSKYKQLVKIILEDLEK